MKRRKRVPSYRLHKPSGQAVVTLSGRDVYLGPYGTKVSKDEYDRVVGEWLANSRRWPEEHEDQGLTVSELILRYWEHCEARYTRDGEATSEQRHIKRAVRVVLRLYGRTFVRDFGPLALKTCREEFVKAGYTRQRINQDVGRVRRMFKWGVANEVTPEGVLRALEAVEGFRQGETDAPEARRVLPVPEEHVEAILGHVSAEVAGMIRVQLLTGMRPGEVVMMRGQDIDRSGSIWVYRPERHKTERFGHAREVAIGPRAQEVLHRFLRVEEEGHLFSPRRAEKARNARRRLARKSPMTPSQRKQRRKAKPKVTTREHYDVGSYGRAIKRGCAKAGVPAWHPHQLRHNAATNIRREFGLDAARVVLGHRSPAITETYAEIDRGKAAEVMERVG